MSVACQLNEEAEILKNCRQGMTSSELGITSFPLFKNKLFQRYCSSGSHVFEFLHHNFEKSAPGNQRRSEVVIERFAAGFLRY